MVESASAVPRTGSSEPGLIDLGNIVLNQGNYRVSVGGRPVDLSYYEFELLRILATNANRVVAFRDLTEALWQSRGHRESRRLNVLAFRLRAKLGDSQPYRIETVRGRGYGLIRPMQSGGHDA